MTWLAQIPGEQLANNVLNSSTLQTLQLIVFMVVLGWVISTWLNGRAVAKMSDTQRSMSTTNERFLEADVKKTAALQSVADETKALRQDYTAGSLTHTGATARLQDTVDEYELRNAERSKSMMDQLGLVKTDLKTDLGEVISDAVTRANATTLEVVKPALDGLDKISRAIDAFGTQQEARVDLLRRQHEEQMSTMKAQGEAQVRTVRTILTETQQAVLAGLKQAQEKPGDTPSSLYPAPPLAPLPPLVNGAHPGPASLPGSDTNLDTRPDRP